VARQRHLYSVGANADHGQRRTNADKRRAVLILLNDEEWGKWSDREIARRCDIAGSGHWLTKIAELRRGLHCPAQDSDPAPSRTFTTKHGTMATMNTENIGRREPAPQQITDMTPQRTLGPPSDGLQFARMAIADLEQIRDDDIQRDDAFALPPQRCGVVRQGLGVDRTAG